jgi:hypothetical protein
MTQPTRCWVSSIIRHGSWMDSSGTSAISGNQRRTKAPFESKRAAWSVGSKMRKMGWRSVPTDAVSWL